MPFILECVVACEKEDSRNNNVICQLSLWKSIKKLLLQPLNNDHQEYQNIQYIRHVNADFNAIIDPPYDNSVLHAFLLTYPEKHTIVLLEKVKRHIASKATKTDNNSIQMIEKCKYYRTDEFP